MKYKLMKLVLMLVPFLASGHAPAKPSSRKAAKQTHKSSSQSQSHGKHLSPKKMAFIDFLHPLILKANAVIQKERNQLLKVREYYLQNGSLTESKRAWLLELSDSYGMKNFDFHLDRDWNELSKRVDIVPAPLVIAQAATESAWGSSRFAVEGNNFFGHWCFTFSCGMIPRNRTPGAKHEVKRFSSPYESVLAYIRNLNSNRAYHAVRTIRADLRNQGKHPSGEALAFGLGKYSSRGHSYIREVQNLIKHNQLEKYHSLPHSA